MEYRVRSCRGNSLGFSIIEVIVGISILSIVIYAGSSILKPLQKANRRMRILSTMARIENEIRNSVYLQNSYTDPSSFSVVYAGKEIARHGKTIYVNDTLSESSESLPLDIKVKLSVQNYSAGVGVLYQVSTNDPTILLKPMGVQSWPNTVSDERAMLEAQLGSGSAAVDSSFSSIAIPNKLSQSTLEECSQGFVRGIDSQGRVQCWEMKADVACPKWSIPVGFRLVDSGSVIELICHKLNRLTCDDLKIKILNPVVRDLNLANFYVLNTLNLNDLYPAQNKTSGALSRCESIIDFNKYGASAQIPFSVVNTEKVNNVTGFCPDKNLYVVDSFGNCLPTFNPATVSQTVPATISSDQTLLVIAQ